MRTRSRTLTAALILALAPLAAADEPSSDWPRYRGPMQDGSSPGNGLLDRDPVGLAVAWKRALGSGYSSISVAGGHGVTMFTDGEDDYLTAFDPSTGEERWRYRIGEMYEGHTGSDDGPISTPTVADGVVYGLGPRGQLFAVRLDDGSEIWSRTLDGETDSQAPFYGFATSPLVAGEVVVVQTGGPEGHSVTAFDRETGEPRWAVEDDPASYQSPAVLEIGGEPQVVAINDKYLIGVDPESGEVRWKHEHGTQAQEAFTQPQALGVGRLLINSLAEVVALEIERSEDGGFDVAELWRSDAFKGSYAVPVFHGGHLYGFSGRFLTAVDAATGEVAWKSRPPGGRGLILVDGQLVVLSNDGEVVVAEASPEGYRERTRLPVFERGGITPASFAGGRIFARNLEEMAAIRITDVPVATAEAAERELLGELGELVRRAEAAEETERQALVDEYLAAHESLPIVEGEDGLVHFVYRGEVDDIAIAGNFLTWEEEVPMDRIAGTDVYFKSFTLDPQAVWEYRYSLNFGDVVADPANPYAIGSFAGPSSELRMPRWREPGHLGEPPEERGRLDSFQFRSEIRGNERRIRLYLPPGYESSGEERYPLLVVHHRESALDNGRMDQALDNLIAAGEVAPLIAVFVQRARGEYASPGAGEYVRMLLEELLPFVDHHYRTLTDPASRALLGVADGGAMAVYVLLEAPDVFGMSASQSTLLRPPVSDELADLIAGAEKLPRKIHVDVRRHDLLIEDAGIDAAADSRRLIDDLEQAGFEVRVREVPGAWGWSSWRARLDDVLGYLFPAAEGD
jgi:outer membrane protein assembly factor BamB